MNKIKFQQLKFFWALEANIDNRWEGFIPTVSAVCFPKNFDYYVYANEKTSVAAILHYIYNEGQIVFFDIWDEEWKFYLWIEDVDNNVKAGSKDNPAVTFHDKIGRAHV